MTNLGRLEICPSGTPYALNLVWVWLRYRLALICPSTNVGSVSSDQMISLETLFVSLSIGEGQKLNIVIFGGAFSSGYVAG